MADQSDVETELLGLIERVVYPEGLTAPSIIGRTCRLYRGWPNASALNGDLAAGRVTVTIFPEPSLQRVTTRFSTEDRVATRISPTLTVTVLDRTATFAGTADVHQVAGLLADQTAVVHRTAAGDTPPLVAAILGSRLRSTGMVATVSGASVTVAGARSLIARVFADQPSVSETRRQQQSFRLTCWCPDPDTRDAAAGALDSALSDQPFVALPDGTSGRLRFVSSTVFDQSQDVALYRRDLLYTVEYATTRASKLPTMLFGDTRIVADGSLARIVVE